MVARELLSYFNTHSRSFRSELRRLNLKNAVDDVHALRVEIKRIRFLLLLLNRFVAGTLAKASYRPYKRVFRDLGELRGLHMKDQLLQKYVPSAAANTARARIRQRALKLTKRLMDRKGKIIASLQVADRQVKKQARGFLSIPAAQYVSNLKGRIEKRITEHTHRSHWHENRKVLKEVVYAKDISPALRRGLSRALQVRKIDQLQDLTGNWHDLLLQREWFKVDTKFLLTLSHQSRIRATERMKKDSARLEGLIQNAIPYIFKNNPQSDDQR